MSKITIPRNLTPVPHARRTEPVDPDRKIDLWSTDLRAKFKAIKEAQQDSTPNVTAMQKRRNSSARGL